MPKHEPIGGDYAKRCSKCKQVYPAELRFPLDPRASDGYGSWCQSCVNDNSLRWRRRRAPKPRSWFEYRGRDRTPETLAVIETYREAEEVRPEPVLPPREGYLGPSSYTTPGDEYGVSEVGGSRYRIPFREEFLLWLRLP